MVPLANLRQIVNAIRIAGDIDSNGVHSWGYWNAQLVAMKSDMQATLGAGGGRA
ncbi:hypothetical protein MGAST_02695 [Mycobacterium gastri 'Wayne']|nr:hypothetical protein MGAST_02695 [Mycobacterium gastri 'Wayne']